MANTIYQATFLTPDNTSIDTAVDNTFTCIVNGTKIDAYQAIVYSRATNSVLHDTGLVLLSTPLYNGDLLEIPINAGSINLGNGQEDKWTVEYFNDLESVVSYETPFDTSTTASLALNAPTTITAQEFEFLGTYTQAESIPLQQWYYVLYDEFDVEIERTVVSFSGDIRHTFSGFLNGSTQKIRGFLITQANEEIESVLYTFNVAYSAPNLDIVPTVTVQDQTTSTLVEWGELVQLSGNVSGGSSSYIENFLFADNWGLQLDAGSILTYNVNIPVEKIVHHVWKQDNASFTGRILKLSNSVTSDLHEVGYENDRFYSDINGQRTYGTMPFSTDRAYIIIIRGTDAIVRE